MRRHWRWLAGWSVLTVLIFVAARNVAWQGALTALAGGHPAWMALAVIINGSILVLATLQWLLYVPTGMHVPPARMFSIVALTSSVSNGGPALAGHATGIHLLATRGGIGHAGGASLTILDQVSEGLAKWFIVAIAAATVPDFQYHAVGLTVILGAPLLTFAIAILANRLHLVRDPAATASGRAGAVLRFISTTLRHLDALRRPGYFALAVVLAILKKAAKGLAMAAVAAAFGLSLPVWVLVAAVVAVNLSTIVPVTPANLGLYEGSAFFVFQASGIQSDVALALAVASHAAYLIPLGGIGLLLESSRLWREAPPR